MDSYKKQALIIFSIIISFEIIVALIGDIRTREAWGDEIRLYASVLNFSDGVSLELLTHYRQMSTPLPFILYAWWGNLFGLELFNFRILSIIIAICTYMLFHYILFEKVKNKKLAVYGILFFVIHPYMVGLSIFLFTDMSAILFLLVGYCSIEKKKYTIAIVAFALSILCRQYMLFILPAIFLYLYSSKPNQLIKSALIAITPALPYFALIILWGGTSPDNEYRALYLSQPFAFHINVFFLYVSLLCTYLIPFYYFLGKTFYKNKHVLISSLLLSILYFFFPIDAAQYSKDIGVFTVGLFHKAFKYIFHSDLIIQLIFYISIVFALPLLITFIKESYLAFINKKMDEIIFLNVIIIFFFIVMPFSYLGWEKYFMPILPFVILRLLLVLDKKNIKEKSLLQEV